MSESVLCLGFYDIPPSDKLYWIITSYNRFFYGYTSNLHWYSTFQYIKNLWVFPDFVFSSLLENLRNIIIIFNMWSVQCHSANKCQCLRLEPKTKSLGQMIFLLKHTSHRQLCHHRHNHIHHHHHHHYHYHRKADQITKMSTSGLRQDTGLASTPLWSICSWYWLPSHLYSSPIVVQE